MTTARSYGGRTAVERAAERRRRLVDATVAVLAEHGPAHATMTAVCQTAGLTERYFYESFSHLDEALLAALDSVCQEIIEVATTTVDSTDGPAEARVHAVMVAVVDLLQQAPAKARVAVVHSNASASLRARRHELTTVFADLVAREAARLYGSEAWPAEQARTYGLVYVTGLAELVASWLDGEVALTPAELVQTAADLFRLLSRRIPT